MALIHCPECGKEVSNQAAACIHCGYPLSKAQEERFALVLLSRDSDYVSTILTVQERLQIDDYTQAKNLVDHLPALLRRDLSYDAAVELASSFRPNVKLVRDRGETDEALLTAPDIPLPDSQEKKAQAGLGFGGTVAAVIVGIFAAVLLLSIL
ncbi:zinc ribbon domain-containing protein [uncultured Intestinimonas sp.]|uniref:zinc ribbon domain-containing protein n=1 Tax=uncultured Intestinimonas sp. TaxID=1689265 RepID=UPI0025FAB7C2|nr:zinc ribbon domain-containing protein [uncultured Intestinimonas sp.]